MVLESMQVGWEPHTRRGGCC